MQYNFHDDIQFITTYFNPAHYKTRFNNYQYFIEPFKKAGIPLLTIECAFHVNEFELKADTNVLSVLAKDVLWQKERLLNLALSYLPKKTTKVAWLDCDIIFTNPNWIRETSQLLENHQAVQLFEKAVWLQAGKTNAEAFDRSWNSFAQSGCDKHGHTGLGWAFQFDLLKKHGFYDAGILGGGDNLMAHAMCGNLENTFIHEYYNNSFNKHFLANLIKSVFNKKYATPTYRKNISQLNKKGMSFFKDHFMEWGGRFYADMDGSINYTSGSILHLWHGNLSKRDYIGRHKVLNKQCFDPKTDICIGPSGCWEWSSNKPALHQAVQSYFDFRQEDVIP